MSPGDWSDGAVGFAGFSGIGKPEGKGDDRLEHGIAAPERPRETDDRGDMTEAR